MPRRGRVHFEGAIYHCYVRGNNKEMIFLSDNDKDKYISLIAKYKNIYDFKLYAYALMNNHVHLLIQVCSDPLSKIMQGIQQSYTQYINRTYQRVGHVFQQRYNCKLCTDSHYLFTLLKYIHYNPVKAELTDELEYKWSSHNYYSHRGTIKSNLVDKEDFFNLLGVDREDSNHVYSQIMNLQDDFEQSYTEAYMDMENVKAHSKEQAHARAEIEAAKAQIASSNDYTFEGAVKHVMKEYKLTEEQLKYSIKLGVEARRMLVFMCIRHNITTRDELSKYLNKTHSRISQLYQEAMKGVRL